VYSRRSVVKASFKRNDHTGGWTAHARYLSRQGAQREQGKGLGFDAEHEGLDMVAVVRDWEKNEELLWRFIVSLLGEAATASQNWFRVFGLRE